MITWGAPEVDGSIIASVQLSDGSYATGTAWYGMGGYCWRVYWNGFQFKGGTGCLDRKEARRAADECLEKILAGECDPPWTQSADRQALEARLLAARARASCEPDLVTLYFGGQKIYP